jgi:HEAT repeat protein
MAVTMDQVLGLIDKDEPEYEQAAKLGPEALPLLQTIAEADNVLLASKAAYLASLIGGDGAADLLQKAAERPEPELRVTVAHALRNADEGQHVLLESLLGDADVGVRTMALTTVGRIGAKPLRDRVTELSKNDPEQFVREKASDTLKRIK